MANQNRIFLYFASTFSVGFYALFTFIPLSFYQSSPLTQGAYINQFIAIGGGLFLGIFLGTFINSDYLLKGVKIFLGIVWVVFLSQMIPFFLKNPGPTFQAFGYFLLIKPLTLTIFNGAIGLLMGVGFANLLMFNYLIKNNVDNADSMGLYKDYKDIWQWYQRIFLPVMCISLALTAISIYISYISSVFMIYVYLSYFVIFGVETIYVLYDDGRGSGVYFEYFKRVLNATEHSISANQDRKRVHWIFGLGEGMQMLFMIIVFGVNAYLTTSFQSEFTLYQNFTYLLIGAAMFLYPAYKIKRSTNSDTYTIIVAGIMILNLFMEYLSEQHIMLRYNLFYMLFYGAIFALVLVHFFDMRISDVSKGQMWFFHNIGIPILFIAMLLCFEFGNDRGYLIELELLNSTYFSFNSIDDLSLVVRISAVVVLLLSIISIETKRLSYILGRYLNKEKIAYREEDILMQNSANLNLSTEEKIGENNQEGKIE